MGSVARPPDLGFGQPGTPILRKDATDEEWTSFKIFLIVFMSVMNVFMFLGNTLSVVTICSNVKLRKQVSYWFVLNLAIIDLLISVSVVPLNIAWEYYGTWPYSHVLCEFFTFADIAFSTISAYSIVLVSIDKYIYITYAIQYYEKMTRRMAIILIVAVWVCVFIFAVISLLTEVGTNEKFEDHFLYLTNNSNTCIFVMTDAFVLPSAILSFFLPFGILCFSSTKIVCIASKHIRKIHTGTHSYISDSDSEILKIARAKAKGTTQTSVYSANESPKALTNGQNSVKSETQAIQKKGKESDDTDVKTKGKESTSGTNDNKSGKKCKIAGQISKKAASINLSEYPLIESRTSNHEFQKQEQVQVPQSNQEETGKSVFTTKSSAQTFSADGIDGNIELTIQAPDNNGDCQAVDEEHGNRPRTQSVKSIVKKSDSMRSVGIQNRRYPYCKLFGTVTIVIACFILMFAPYNVAIVVDVWCHCIEAWIYEDILAVLYYMHSLVNPYIYMATDRKYKMALRQLRRRVWNCFKTDKLKSHCRDSDSLYCR